MNPNRKENPVAAELNIDNFDISRMQPKQHTLKNGIQIDVFPSNAVEIMRLDFVFEAGKAYTDNPLAAIATMALITEGTTHHTAKEIADFLNFRGITVERSTDSLNTCFTFYLQNKYLTEFLPLLQEIFCHCTFPENEYDIFIGKKRQELDKQLQKTSYQASITCIEHIFGTENVFGRYLKPSHFDSISLDQVRDFYHKFYKWGNCKLFAAGNINQRQIEAFENTLGTLDCYEKNTIIEPQTFANPPVKKHIAMRDAVQTSIRIGKIINTRWDSMEFAKLMVTNNLLGGYFGSRLMMNVREDKGYCYGIYSTMQVERNAIYMLIATEVGSAVTNAAINEIFFEIKRLQTEPVGKDELQRSKNYLAGDFLRSVDGVYELLERDRTLHTTHSSDTFTKNLLKAIDETTADDIIALATKHFNTNDFVQITAGNI